MRKACIFIFVLMLISACTASATTTPQEEVEIPIILTSTQSYTSTFTTTPTNTLIAPTNTPTIICDCTGTPTHTPKATWPPTSDSPGILLKGSVTLPNGSALTAVEIYYAFADSTNLLDTTNSTGNYEGFIYIPSDETIKVWAVLAGYEFKPAGGNKAWINGEFEWDHHAGYEKVELSFIGTPE